MSVDIACATSAGMANGRKRNPSATTIGNNPIQVVSAIFHFGGGL
jgi:hypothetical protein